MLSYRCQRNSSQVRSIQVINRSFEHHKSSRRIWLDFSPNFKGEYPKCIQASPISLPLPPTSREDLGIYAYLECSHVTEVQLIYNPCLLWDLNPGTTAQQSVSPTTIPDGRLNFV
ncbi:hypothetical protein TNCV_2118111 [Trichonephila clavipes]|nr:hypothetical protein TNCV_2118111 [Trichonephila clavipes]